MRDTVEIAGKPNAGGTGVGDPKSLTCRRHDYANHGISTGSQYRHTPECINETICRRLPSH